MNLRKLVIRDKETSRELRAVLPEADTTDPLPEVVEINFRQKTRRVSGAILEMVLAFNREQQERDLLHHDCGTFVVACITGDPQRNVLRTNDSLDILSLTNREDVNEHPEGIDLEPNQAMLIHRTDEEGAFELGTHHYAFPTSIDEEYPRIFASKLGRGPNGPVVLHTFSGIVSYFDATVVRAATFAQGSVDSVA